MDIFLAIVLILISFSSITSIFLFLKREMNIKNEDFQDLNFKDVELLDIDTDLIR